MKRNYRILMIGVMALLLAAAMGIGVFAETDSGWKPSQNQDKFEGIEYGRGMLSAAAKGTDIVINDDGTVTLNITTKPMVSTQYKKVAFSLEPFPDKKEDKEEAMEEAAAGISVTIGTADDVYINPFASDPEEANEGIKTYYWSVFSYIIPVEALEQTIYTAGFNVMKKVGDKYEEQGDGAWAYSSTWSINPTQELIKKLRDKQASVADTGIAARIGQTADNLEVKYHEKLLDEARQAIEAAKADLTNKKLVLAALAACEKLTDEQKAALADDIKALQNAKAKIEEKEKKEAEEKKAAKAKAAAIAKVQNGKISGLKVKAGKKKITVTWKKNKVFAGYKLKYTVGSKTKIMTINKVKTVRKVIKKLKKGKVVKVRIRGYKKMYGKIYTGKWTAVKKAKVK